MPHWDDYKQHFPYIPDNEYVQLKHLLYAASTASAFEASVLAERIFIGTTGPIRGALWPVVKDGHQNKCEYMRELSEDDSLVSKSGYISLEVEDKIAADVAYRGGYVASKLLSDRASNWLALLQKRKGRAEEVLDSLIPTEIYIPDDSINHYRYVEYLVEDHNFLLSPEFATNIAMVCCRVELFRKIHPSLTLHQTIKKVVPYAEAWIVEMLMHLNSYQTIPTDPGFMLRSARLCLGIDRKDADLYGFGRMNLKYHELGNKLQALKTIRSVVILYDLSYAKFIRIVMKHLLRASNNFEAISRLPYYDPRSFIDGTNMHLINEYLANPGSIEELMFFKQGATSLTTLEISDCMGVSRDTYLSMLNPNISNGVSEKVIRTWCEIMNANVRFIFLEMFNKKYYPLLNRAERRYLRGRIRRDPIFIVPNSCDLETLKSYAKNQNSLGEYLFFARKLKGLTLEEAEATVGIGWQALRKMEMNEELPEIDTVNKLAEGYSIEKAEMLKLRFKAAASNS